MPSNVTPISQSIPLTPNDITMLRHFRSATNEAQQLMMAMIADFVRAYPAKPKAQLSLVKSSGINGGRHA